MPYFLWTEDLITGDKVLDADHRGLVVVIDAMIAALDGGASEGTVGMHLSNLIAYASGHFDREKSRVDQMRWGEAQAHIDDHNRLLTEAERIQKQIELGAPINLAEMYDFLRTWLGSHITTFDMRIVMNFN
jgi:hemerythrin-like metal-binding protein